MLRGSQPACCPRSRTGRSHPPLARSMRWRGAQRADQRLFARRGAARLLLRQPGTGVRIERRGTKAGHHYDLLGHSLSGEIVVEPYLITLRKDAEPYTCFRHAGVEFIYMLTGGASTATPTRPTCWPGGRLVLRLRRPPRSRGADRVADDLSVDHHLSATMTGRALLATPGLSTFRQRPRRAGKAHLVTGSTDFLCSLL